MRTQFGTQRSPAVVKLLNIKFLKASLDAKTADDGATTLPFMDAVKKLEKNATARPALIYAYDASAKPRALREVERKFFRTENVAVAQHFFHMVMVKANDTVTPGFHVVKPCGTIVGSVETSAKQKDLMKLLQSGFESYYAVKMDAASKALGAYLGKLQAAEDQANLKPSATTAKAFADVKKGITKVLTLPVKKAKAHK